MLEQIYRKSKSFFIRTQSHARNDGAVEETVRQAVSSSAQHHHFPPGLQDCVRIKKIQTQGKSNVRKELKKAFLPQLQKTKRQSNFLRADILLPLYAVFQPFVCFKIVLNQIFELRIARRRWYVICMRKLRIFYPYLLRCVLWGLFLPIIFFLETSLRSKARCFGKLWEKSETFAVLYVYGRIYTISNIISVTF